MYVDGTGIGDVGRVVLQEREILSNSGVVVAVIRLSKGQISALPEIVTKGFVFEKINTKLLTETATQLEKKLRASGKLNKRTIDVLTQDFLGQHLFSKLERRPLIIPVVIEQ